MADPIYQEKLAQAIYAGVVRYCGQVPIRGCSRRELDLSLRLFAF